MQSLKINFEKPTRLVIFLSATIFINFTLCAQQAPEPPEGQMAGQPVRLNHSEEPGLLFYLSGKKGFEADFAAGGQAFPNFMKDVNIIEAGPFGASIEARDSQLLSYWAPGNIYTQQGTLSFFWRSRYPAGPTEFPVFRVAYADHSSWEMVWLRIDYNGSGFDAFVTDVGLARTRVSYHMDKLPQPDEWTHLALSWDETRGIRFYVNGKLAGEKTGSGMIYDAGLDQFGPHSRIISPHQVQSAMNFVRGGDLAEIRIYDRMLSDDNIASLSQGKIPSDIPSFHRNLSERRWRDSWWKKHGWNLPNEAPPLLESEFTSVRKVEIHKAIDVKRWNWKANDGIRETTWPSPYNKSRIPGRYDYFIAPDWDCYSMSGRTIRFEIPETESWNHIEMWGTAWGQLTHEKDHEYDHTFAVVEPEQVKFFHRLNETKKGGIIRYDNALIEEPIGSIMVYDVGKGKAPADHKSETFTLTVAPQNISNKRMQEVSMFINGRYPEDERSMMVGIPENEDPSEFKIQTAEYNHPLVHILIPYKNTLDGLDGIEIKIPAMDVVPTHGNVFPINLRIKDPLWQMRDLADLSFSIEPGKSYTLWMDTRDRILPEGKALYISLSGAGDDFTAETLKGAKVRLVYKKKEEALAEHVIDRFTQLRDLHANNTEERPATPRLNNYNRFYADVHDILKHDPDHWLTRAYWYWLTGDKNDRPEFSIPAKALNVPDWAHLQIQILKQYERLAMYYIDNRQIANGEMGGGLGDDGKFTFFFPFLAYSGVQPEKIYASLALLMEAYYDQDRDPYFAPLRIRSLPYISNGISTILSDELHNYEDGIQVLGQILLLNNGNPLYFERGMETSKKLLDDITQISPDGHRRFRSQYFSGTRIATEDPWQWSTHYSAIILHPALLIARHNGNPEIQKMIVELADGLLDVSKQGDIYPEVHFQTGEIRGRSRLVSALSVFQAAYSYTGNRKYLEPIKNEINTNREFDPERLERMYREKVKDMGVQKYINTEGSIWIDRVPVRSTAWLQEHRLGGVAVEQAQNNFPRHRISWRFPHPFSYKDLAVYVTKGTEKEIDIICYNLNEKEIEADLTTWEIQPGKWSIRQGLDTNDDLEIDSGSSEILADLRRGSKLRLSFPPRSYTILHLSLKDAAAEQVQIPDLALARNDIKIEENRIKIRVHNLGSKPSPESTLEVRDATGEVIITAKIPVIEAPADLLPRWTEILVYVPEGTDLSKGKVILDPDEKVKQISRSNTVINW